MRPKILDLNKTDESLETEGVWLAMPDGSEYRVKRFGGFNTSEIERIRAQRLKPVAKLVEKGLLPQEQLNKINTEIFLESCLVDWKNVFEEEVPYSLDLAKEIFVEHKGMNDSEIQAINEILSYLIEYSLAKDTYKEDLGNSLPDLSGGN